MKHVHVIFTVILAQFIIPLSVHAVEIRYVKDPINDSYIINSLEMETENPEGWDDDSDSSGEIIYDDSFLKHNKINNNSAVLKKLKSEDERWHLVEYMVKSDDNLWNIAKEFEVDSSAIIELNNIKNPDHLKKGQVLLVPSKNGIYYTIRKGDFLGKIAKKFNSDIDEIRQVNNIQGNHIAAGKRIFIPDAIEKKIVISNKKKTVASKKTDIVSTKKKRKEKNIAGIRLSWPLRGPLTSSFGYRKDPFSGNKMFHCGIDIGANIGTPVKASGEGRVIFSGWKGGYGYMVVISHADNYITVYAHNSKNLVETDEIVKKGQVIALSGNTGATTGAHLHFEIRKGTVPLNPLRVLKK